MEVIALRGFGKKILEGEIYEVIGEKSAMYRVEDEEGNKLNYPKSIFEEVEDDTIYDGVSEVQDTEEEDDGEGYEISEE